MTGATVTADLLAEDGIRLATRAGGLLAAFNARGVLAATDVHVARRLGRLGGGPAGAPDGGVPVELPGPGPVGR